MQTIDEQSTILLLGNVDHEGIISTIKTSKYSYQKKILDSTRENWGTIIELLGSSAVAAVVVKLTSNVYSLLTDSRYDWVGDQLLSALAIKRNIIFAYDSLMDPNPSAEPEDDLEDHRYHYYRHMPPPAETREAVKKRLEKAGLKVLSYSSNAELTVMATQFLREVTSNLLFRLYVPHGRLYATELDKLLQLFKDYMDGTGRRGINLNKVNADHGISYEFCGDHSTGVSLSDDFEDFSKFMNLCVTDVEKARSMLSLKAVDPKQIIRIVDRYTKEARRLTLDITQEREMKVLGIRHRLESELTDIAGDVSSNVLRQIVDEAIPVSPSLLDLGRLHADSLAGNLSNITVNINPQIIENARGIITNEVKGVFNLGPKGDGLAEVIAKYGALQADELTNDLRQVADTGIPESLRVTKANKLKSFLYGLAPEIAKGGIHLLEDYLKGKLH